jgi:hypothetical protein
MEPGFTEVTGSQTENIGLPNWSFIKLTASAKAIVPDVQYDQGSHFMELVTSTVVRERVESIAKQLNVWAGIETTVLDQGTKDGIVPQGIDYATCELSFTRIEIVGMPDKCSINLLESAKRVCLAGLELATLEEMADLVSARMKDKRDVVLANPRPWINSQS